MSTIGDPGSARRERWPSASRGANRGEALWRLAAALALLWLAGCLDGGGAGSGGGGSLEGVWSTAQSGCEQRLAFGPDGGFVSGVTVSGGGEFPVPLVGRIDAATPVGDGVQVRIDPGQPAVPDTLLSCGQWLRRRELPVPTGPLAAAGFDLEHLRPVAAVGSVLGAVRVWVDATREAVLVTALSGGRLLAMDLSGAPAGPFFTAYPDDPVFGENFGLPFPVLDLPGGLYHEAFSLDAPGGLASRLLLNVTAATRLTVTVSGPDGNTACQPVAYDLAFTAPVTPPPLDAGAGVQSIDLDPLAGALSFHEIPVNGPSGASTAYIWPFAVVSPAAGDCTVTLQARALAAEAAGEMLAVPGAEPLLELPFVAARTLTLLSPGEHGERMVAVPYRPLDLVDSVPGSDWGGLLSYPQPTAEPAGELDPFGLATDGGRTPLLRVSGSGESKVLSIFPDPEASLGTGALTPFEPAAAAVQLQLPGSRPLSLTADGPSQRLALELAMANRVDLWSEGGLDSHARLTDGEGWLLASDDNSADDGVGFRIRRRLAAGGYVLHVGSREAGTVDVFAAVAPAPDVADDALDHCFLENGWNPAAPNGLETLNCTGEGVSDLTGIGVAPRLRVLRLGANHIGNLGPLTALTRLRVLSLAGNPVSGLSPLAGLPLLHTLSLAHTAVGADELSELAPLADRLALLDLAGVPDLGHAALAAVQAMLPHTTLIAPDGRIWP